MVVDRESLGLRWRRQVADALTSAGHQVRPHKGVIDGPQVCVIAAEVRGHVSHGELAALGDMLSHALNIAAEVRLTRRGRWLVAEVPWPTRRMIPAAKMRAASLRFEIGITPIGQRVVVDLDSTPHLLIAGQTGSGKSETLRSTAVLLAGANSPEDLPFVAVDYDLGHPEAAFTPLVDLAHLARPVACTLDESRAALQWVVATFVNGRADTGCVVFVDEGAELRDDRAAVEALRAIAMRGRKRGVHLVLAAQRSTESVARNIVTQFGARICGNVFDYHESNTIVGTSGAEKLLPHGDMLARIGGRAPVRFQAALTSEADVARLPMLIRHAADLSDDGNPIVDDDTPALENSDAALIAWAIQTGRQRRRGGTVATAEAIRERVGCGTDEARRLRDLAQAVSTYLPAPEAMPAGHFDGSPVAGQ